MRPHWSLHSTIWQLAGPRPSLDISHSPGHPGLGRRRHRRRWGQDQSEGRSEHFDILSAHVIHTSRLTDVTGLSYFRTKQPWKLSVESRLARWPPQPPVLISVDIWEEISILPRDRQVATPWSAAAARSSRGCVIPGLVEHMTARDAAADRGYWCSWAVWSSSVSVFLSAAGFVAINPGRSGCTGIWSSHHTCYHQHLLLHTKPRTVTAQHRYIGTTEYWRGVENKLAQTLYLIQSEFMGFLSK